MIERTTQYVHDVQEFMAHSGHATNGDILDHLQKTHRDISATTVHRITARLVERGKLGLAPTAKGNVMRFDTNTDSHDHFVCSNCDMVRDTYVAAEIRPILERSIGEGCRIAGNLVIAGLCKQCNKG